MSTEPFSIFGAVEGEYYLLMISNFASQPGWISITQENLGEAGAGSSDCSIVVGNLGEDREACLDSIIELDGTTENAVVYSWSRDITPGDGIENFDPIDGEEDPILVIDDNISGIYRLTVESEEGDTDFDDVVIRFVPDPVVEVGELGLCSDSDIARFSLTNLDRLVTPETDVTVRYYDTEEDALNEIDPLDNTFETTSRTIYARVTNDIGCFSITTAELIVYPNPLENEVSDVILCEDDGDGTVLFNLLIKVDEALGTQSADDFSVRFYPTRNDASSESNEITDPENFRNSTNPQTIYLRVEDNTGISCFRILSFEITVEQIPETNDVPISVPTCSDTLIAEFNLLTIVDQVANFNTDMDVEFYEDFDLTIPIVNPSSFSSETTTVYGQVTNPTTGCFGIGEVQLAVLQNPERRDQALENCADNADNNTASFDLSQLTDDIINTAQNVTVSYHENFEDASAPNSGGDNPIVDLINYRGTTSIIYARSEASFNGEQCFTVSEISLTVFERPEANDITYPLCSDTDESEFDLLSQLNFINSDPSSVSVSFFVDEMRTIPISNPESFSSISGTVFVTVVDDLTGCEDQSSIVLEVIRNPRLTEAVEETLCLTNEEANFNLLELRVRLELEYPDRNFSFFEDEDLSIPINNNFIATESTTIYTRYQIVGTDCFHSDPVFLNVSLTPEEDFGEHIICLSEGFTLPNGEVVFDSGTYFRIIQDEDGCDILSKTSLIVGSVEFASAFAPNGNGLNEQFGGIPSDECVGLVDDYHLVVFNRWGEKVFETRDFLNRWDGRTNDTSLVGTYLWQATYTFQNESFNRTGTVALLF